MLGKRWKTTGLYLSLVYNYRYVWLNGLPCFLRMFAAHELVFTFFGQLHKEQSPKILELETWLLEQIRQLLGELKRLQKDPTL